MSLQKLIIGIAIAVSTVGLGSLLVFDAQAASLNTSDRTSQATGLAAINSSFAQLGLSEASEQSLRMKASAWYDHLRTNSFIAWLTSGILSGQKPVEETPPPEPTPNPTPTPTPIPTPPPDDPTPPPTPKTWPASPPAQICGNESILGKGPTTPPAGALVIPAGDNSALLDEFTEEGKVFWFKKGVHTLGTDPYNQIGPGNNSTFIGEPGAIIDGKRVNRYAFGGQSTGVTIRYLTVRNFVSPNNEGVVNQGQGDNWTVEYTTITNNEGAGLMGGSNIKYRYNCIKDNGQYGMNGCCGGDSAATDNQNMVITNNEIAGNNKSDVEAHEPNCGCTGGIKFWLNKNVTFTDNWVHDNHGPGIWLDNNNISFKIEHNYFDNNEGEAIFLEAGYDASIRYNNIKRNAIVVGREFAARGDYFPVAAIYISENGSPRNQGLKYVPTVISNNNFENNWGAIAMWENPNRYAGSSGHTHLSGTIKIGNLYDDAQCEEPGNPDSDVIPSSIGDKYKCRWSTENNLVENNVFRINKEAIGEGCVGADFCGINGIFSTYGIYPEFGGYEIPTRITFKQDNVFRNNQYYGPWKFAGFMPTLMDGSRATWEQWRAKPPTDMNFSHSYLPEAFGQDAGSTYNP